MPSHSYRYSIPIDAINCIGFVVSVSQLDAKKKKSAYKVQYLQIVYYDHEINWMYNCLFYSISYFIIFIDLIYCFIQMQITIYNCYNLPYILYANCIIYVNMSVMHVWLWLYDVCLLLIMDK